MNHYKELVLAWWANLQARERLIVAVGGIALALILFYLIVWSPLQSSVMRLNAVVPQDRMKLAQMRAQAQEITQLQGHGGTGVAHTDNLLSTLEQTATSRGLRQAITRMEPEGNNGARVAMDEVSFNNLVSWLADLQTQGIRIEDAAVQKKTTAGMVSARLSLRSGGI